MSVTPEMRMWAFGLTNTWSRLDGKNVSTENRVQWADELAEWAATGRFGSPAEVCGFCGATGKGVHLVAGMTAMICNSCVADAAAVVSSPDGAEPAPTEVTQ